MESWTCQTTRFRDISSVEDSGSTLHCKKQEVFSLSGTVENKSLNYVLRVNERNIEA